MMDYGNEAWYDNYCFARESLGDDRIFNCDMTLYYLRWQVDFHCSPGEMADKNIRTDYSKLKMLARIDRDSVQEENRMVPSRKSRQKERSWWTYIHPFLPNG